MKAILRKIFSPILNYFEAGDGVYAYKKSHRVVLLVVGILFTLLSVSIFIAGMMFARIEALLPGVVFFAIGITSLVVGALGSNRAVSKIWGNK